MNDAIIKKLEQAIALPDTEMRTFLTEWKLELHESNKVLRWEGPSIINADQFLATANRMGEPIYVTLIVREQVRYNGVDIELKGADFKNTVDEEHLDEFNDWIGSNFSADDIDDFQLGWFLQVLVGNEPNPEMLTMMANQDTFIIKGLTEQQQFDIFMNWNLFLEDNTVFDHMSDDCIEQQEGLDS